MPLPSEYRQFNGRVCSVRAAGAVEKFSSADRSFASFVQLSTLSSCYVFGRLALDNNFLQV